MPRKLPPKQMRILTKVLQTKGIDLREMPLDWKGKSTVYIMIGYGDEILYIGRSCRMAPRLEQHSCFKQTRRVFYVVVPDAEVDSMEATLICIFKPRLNGVILHRKLDKSLIEPFRNNGVSIIDPKQNWSMNNPNPNGPKILRSSRRKRGASND